MNRAVDPAPETRSRVAVIGSGVAGLTAAHVISRSADVTLFEADDRLGGHADTHSVTDAAGNELAIDSGFIVHNERTYPTLLRLFRELGVTTQPSEMSMSVRDEATGLEYAGALGLSGLFPTWRSLARPAHLRMLGEVPRFHRAARRLLASPSSADDDETLRDFLARGNYSAYFVRHFMEPLVAAVWSCDPAVALDYPARYLFTFLDHHGTLRIFGSPQWRTVTGGSREYVARIAAQLADVRVGTKVTSVLETPDGVEVCDGNGEVSTYDAVVVATHPAHALAMLARPTAAQQEVLAALPYSANTALLHTDDSLLPRSTRARASWNFLRPRAERAGVTVTYDLTRLQRLPTEQRYLVTLGGEGLVDPATVIERREYEHPLYTPTSVAAQRRLPECDTERIAFAGAYAGWGFHEDGARSGAGAASHLGFGWAPKASLPATGRIYATTIRHARRTPLRHAFTYRSHSWLVDLDDLPRASPLASFQARDHLGSPDRTLRENLDGFLATQGIDLDGGRILMLANARVLGYCFNPISIFWCHRPDSSLECVVVEVHNTYGERHAYVVRTDEHGRASVPKQLYVSPFNDTSGAYELALPVPGERLAVSITLQPGGFTASMTGQVLPPGRASLVRASLRTPLAPLLGMLRIRIQGIRLWLRGLKVQPRPVHPSQEGVQ
jgi:predicted NAD/FAD-binding protein/DUF1365 family protein